MMDARVIKSGGEYWLAMGGSKGQSVACRIEARGELAITMMDRLAKETPKVVPEPRLQSLIEELDEVVAWVSMAPDSMVRKDMVVNRLKTTANRYRTDDMVGG